MAWQPVSCPYTTPRAHWEGLCRDRGSPSSGWSWASASRLGVGVGALAGGVGIRLPVPAMPPAPTGSLKVRLCPGMWEAVLEAGLGGFRSQVAPQGDPVRQWGFLSFADEETKAQRFSSFTQIQA